MEAEGTPLLRRLEVEVLPASRAAAEAFYYLSLGCFFIKLVEIDRFNVKGTSHWPAGFLRVFPAGASLAWYLPVNDQKTRFLIIKREKTGKKEDLEPNLRANLFDCNMPSIFVTPRK